MSVVYEPRTTRATRHRFAFKPPYLLTFLFFWLITTWLFHLPLIALDGVVNHGGWQIPHLLRLPITLGFVGVTVYEGWGQRKKVIPRSLWFTLLILTVVCCRWNTLAGFEHSTDEGGTTLAARTLLTDPRFWISVDVGTHGPLVSLWQTLLPSLGLDIDYAGSRLLGSAMLIGCVLCGFAILRRAASEQTTRLLCLPLVLSVAATVLPDITAYNGEHPLMFLTMLGAACAVSALLQPWNGAAVQQEILSERRRLLLLLLAGVFVGSICWAKNQGIPIAFVLSVVIMTGLWLTPVPVLGASGPHRGTLRRRIFAFLSGLLLATLLITAWVSATGALDEMIRSYFVWNFTYATRFKDPHPLTTFVMVGKWGFRNFVQMSRFTTVFHVAVVVGWAGLALTWMRKRLRPAGDNRRTIALISAVGAVALATWFSAIKPGALYPHYLLLPLFPTILVHLLAWAMILESQDSAGTTPSSIRLWRVTFVTFAVLLPLCVWGFVRGPQGGSGQLLVPFVHRHDEMKALAERVKTWTRPSERVAVWGILPSLHISADRLSSHRTVDGCLRAALLPMDDSGYFYHLYLQDWDRNPPVVFVDELRVNHIKNASEVTQHSRLVLVYRELAERVTSLPPRTDENFTHENFPELAARVDENYRLIYTSRDGIRFYVRNDRLRELSGLVGN